MPSRMISGVALEGFARLRAAEGISACRAVRATAVSSEPGGVRVPMPACSIDAPIASAASPTRAAIAHTSLPIAAGQRAVNSRSRGWRSMHHARMRCHAIIAPHVWCVSSGAACRGLLPRVQDRSRAYGRRRRRRIGARDLRLLPEPAQLPRRTSCRGVSSAESIEADRPIGLGDQLACGRERRPAREPCWSRRVTRCRSRRLAPRPSTGLGTP